MRHPVHIINKNKQLSPSAFIPFCEFGGNISVMGVTMDMFDVPVCNSFYEKVLNDQLCYEVDLHKFSNVNNIEKELKSGLAFIMDYNEDRHIALDGVSQNIKMDQSFVSMIDKSDEIQHASIYLNTIGNFDFLLQIQSII